MKRPAGKLLARLSKRCVGTVAGTISQLGDLGFREGSDKPIYNPQEELMDFSTSVASAEKSLDVDLREEIGKLVGQRLMTPGPQIERAHDIERIMSSVARLTSSSIEGLENLTSELHDLQKFLETEVARVQSEVDNAMAGIKIIMEAIAPLRSLQTSGAAGSIIRSGPAANISAPSHQAPAFTPSAETLKPKPE